jgi:hypothetical protein
MLLAACAGSAGAAAVDPFIFVDRNGEAVTVMVSRSRNQVMFQRTNHSLVDVAHIPEVVLSQVRFEEVGDSGIAGLMVILAQDDHTDDDTARIALVGQWLRQRYTDAPVGAHGDETQHEHRTGFVATDDPFSSMGLDDRINRVSRHRVATDKPLETPGRVSRASGRGGVVRADQAAPVGKPRGVAATPAPPGAVQSTPDEGDDDIHAIVFVATSGNLAAEARFWQDGSNLMIQLTNTSTVNPATVSEVLTALFFNIAGQPTLTPISVVMTAGSKILYPITLPTDGKTVSFEWAYRAGDVKSPGNMEYGVSVTAFNAIFKPADRFPGPSLHGNGNNMSDVSFGLVGPGKTNTGSNAMTGQLSFIQDSVIFTLAGLPEDFDLLTDIDHVWFQYGNSLNSPSMESFRITQKWEEELLKPPDPPDPPDVPEPATLSLLMISALGLLRRRRV